MDIKTKGLLVEKFVECSNYLDLAKKRVYELEDKQEKLAHLISIDGDLCNLLIAGGISTLDGNLLVVNKNKLEVKKVVNSYSIKSELTDEQLKGIEDDK